MMFTEIRLYCQKRKILERRDCYQEGILCFIARQTVSLSFQVVSGHLFSILLDTRQDNMLNINIHLEGRCYK